MPLISIIIPVYNTGEYLVRCVNSVTAQTYKNIEIILVNDGSTDNSGVICDDIAKCDERITVIHKENGGLSSARNCGMRAASGNYFIFIDSDDYIEPNMCEVLYNAVIVDECDMAVCGINNIDENGKPIEEMNEQCPLLRCIMNGDDYRKALLRRGNWYYIVAWNKIYKKSVFENVEYPEGYIHEDEYVIHRIVGNCKKIAVTDEKMYNYIMRKTSITNEKYSVARLDIMGALLDRMNYYIKTNVDGETIAAMAKETIKTLYNCYARSDMKNPDFKARYSILSRDLKKTVKCVLKFKMRVDYRAFLTANLVSPYIIYKLFGRFIKD